MKSLKSDPLYPETKHRLTLSPFVDRKKEIVLCNFAKIYLLNIVFCVVDHDEDRRFMLSHPLEQMLESENTVALCHTRSQSKEPIVVGENTISVIFEQKNIDILISRAH